MKILKDVLGVGATNPMNRRGIAVPCGGGVWLPVASTRWRRELSGLVLGLVTACGGESAVSGELTGAPLVDLTEASAAECPDGGVVVQVGGDENGDDELSIDEVVESQVVCNGAPGRDGVDGQDGRDGVDGAPGNRGGLTLEAVWLCAGPGWEWEVYDPELETTQKFFGGTTFAYNFGTAWYLSGYATEAYDSGLGFFYFDNAYDARWWSAASVAVTQNEEISIYPGYLQIDFNVRTRRARYSVPRLSAGGPVTVSCEQVYP